MRNSPAKSRGKFVADDIGSSPRPQNLWRFDQLVWVQGNQSQDPWMETHAYLEGRGEVEREWRRARGGRSGAAAQSYGTAAVGQMYISDQFDFDFDLRTYCLDFF